MMWQLIKRNRKFYPYYNLIPKFGSPLESFLVKFLSELIYSYLIGTILRKLQLVQQIQSLKFAEFYLKICTENICCSIRRIIIVDNKKYLFPKFVRVFAKVIYFVKLSHFSFCFVYCFS